MKYLIMISLTIGLHATSYASTKGSCGVSQTFSDTAKDNSELVSKFGKMSALSTLNVIHVNCAEGSGRLTDKEYHTTDTGLNQLYGPFNKGPLPTKTNTSIKTYIGITPSGDMMKVLKMVDQNFDVIGYNVTISYCNHSTQDGYPFISQEREFETEIKAMVLDSDNRCGFGSIDSANTNIRLSNWEGKSAEGFPIRDFQRSFDKNYFHLDCLGSY